MKKLASKIWNFSRNLLAKRGEEGTYSSGYWPTKIRDAAVKLMPSRGTVLEVGCGEGIFLAALNKIRPNVQLYGVDTSAELLDQAKERLKGVEAELKVADGLSLPYPDSFFDTAVSVNVLLNLPGIEEADRLVCEMIRVVKPGGRVVFDIRNARSPLFKLQYSMTAILDPEIKVPLNTYKLEDFKSCIFKYKKHYIGMPRGRYAPVIVVEAKKA